MLPSPGGAEVVGASDSVVGSAGFSVEGPADGPVGGSVVVVVELVAQPIWELWHCGQKLADCSSQSPNSQQLTPPSYE